jgi:predicted NodU family carbamoyl transferase
VLGISAFYHDSAACLLADGDIVAAAQEERFTRKKGDADFPHHAVAYCLRTAGIAPGELVSVGFYDKPLIKFQIWRHKFADHLTSIEAARWLTYRACDLFARKEPAVKEISMAKLTLYHAAPSRSSRRSS